VRKCALLILCLLGPAFAQAAGTWWNQDWNFRKEISVDLSASGANLTGSAADVPVLVRLHLGNFGYFGDTKPDGSDLRFIAADDKTPLKFHVERYDATNNLAFVWVKVPRVAGAAVEKIYLYYGNTKAPAAADAPGTYDANQVLVYHFSGDGSGGGGAPQDATAYANNASTAATTNAASLIGAGASFAGSAAISVPATASLRLVPAKGLTLSTWVRIEGPQSNASLLELTDQTRALTLGIDGLRVFVRARANAQDVASAQTSDILAAGQWHHVALTVGGGRLLLYVDGVELAATPAELGEIGGTLSIGGAAAGANFLTGEIDEVEVSNVARNPTWLQVAARGQGVESALVAYGKDEGREGSGGDVSYFATTLKNVTPDGWAVIVVLAVMFVIALMIIISKAVYLSRVKQANASFLKQFERLKGDPTALDKPESETDAGDAALDESPFMPHLKGDAGEYRLSTLYRLYHHGVQEMTGRIGLKSAGARAVTTLTPQAIEAIRATMDASLVRLTQKLGARMVILTIAISGGPFLGLLGTVIGVMITFAAIAASGDVNVNSIAPGIAAALAATVAGLAVAIPALFGYNWLNTQIKEVNADMRVFVDEFVTRVAEHYT
jgi:biopolymer transport protein ExbB